MSWYTTGYDGIHEEERRLQASRGVDRLWIKPGTSQEVIFVDDTPFSIHEHNPYLNDSWRNHMTCLRGVYDDVACCEKIGGDSPDRYYVGYYTGVDLSQWQDKRGGHHQYELKLVPAKLKSLKLLRRKKEDHGLKGCLYKLTRDDKTDPVVGNDLSFLRQADMDKLFDVVMYKGRLLRELFSDPDEKVREELLNTFQIRLDDMGALVQEIPCFNYPQILKPYEPKVVREMLAGYKRRSKNRNSEDVSKSYGADDNVPF